MSAPALLEVRGLWTSFATPDGPLQAVDGVDLAIDRGESLALVGESGSGKSTLALSILRLLPAGGSIDAGSVRLEGRELRHLDERALRSVRGREIGLVLQDASSALDPLWRVGTQLVEVLQAQLGLGDADARARAHALLARVGFSDPAGAAGLFPHELSGGMRQRAACALGVACEPKLLLADEPTSALDVTLQKGLLALLLDLCRERRMGLLLVTHDVALAAEHCARLAVMYAGRIVEEGPAASLLVDPKHPYTALLLRSAPAFAARTVGARRARLEVIPGAPPPAHARPSGCRFRTRCPIVRERCAAEEPLLVRLGGGRASACHFPDEVTAP